ncbi:hypothetical protein [Actinocrinis sp.]|uniref:hypothetical protein n=1 Tax=Actinocrinis sp. TaxID=1920516 RepID=UPI002D273A45|nr:hypothetical protein [Actinocrinis sp.]HZP55043.1 hypothetical protein [Actinocrinis sp.]
MRIAAPDGAVAGMEVKGAYTGRVTRYNGRIMDVENPAHAKALIAEGAFPVSLTGRTRADLGYRCPACGHGSFFVRCGKCGGQCERES